MAFEHPSGLPSAFARHRGQRDVQSLVFYGQEPYAETTEINDLQDVIRGRQQRLGRLVAEDGDRVRGAFAVVDIEAATVTLTEGELYIDGDVMQVAEAVLADVPMVGDVAIGVRLVRVYLTSEDDPTLLGLVPGSDAEGEPGAARELATISWARGDDGGEGDFYQVYLMKDGTVLDQTPPPALDGMMQALALYDRPHGHYIVSGNRVSSLGLIAGDRVFSIEEGEANILGVKVVRYASLRHAEPEEWDVGAVPGETHTYGGGASQTVTLDLVPLDEVTSILLTKEKTATVTRGALANGIDGLPDDSVVSIVSVSQGATTFVAGTDYVRTGNGVDWAAAGVEPAAGSTYTVTYRYRDDVEPDAITPTTVTVSGGAAGGDIIIAYTYKLPRIDILGLLPSGRPVYVRGVSARANPVRPIPPGNVLPLAEIRNSWMADPMIVSDRVNTGVRMPTWSDFWRYMNVLENHNRLMQLNRLEQEVDQRDPAAKRGMFVDPFMTNEFRDAGVAQNGAVGNGILQLDIVPTFYDTTLETAVTLDWVEEVLVEQPLITACEKINPYQNFTPMPGQLELTPSVDFWTVSATEWLPDRTIEFQRNSNLWATASNGRVAFPSTTSESSSSTTNQVGEREELLPFLRERDVDFVLSGFFPGEVLDSLTFDGVDVMPEGLPAANAGGQISGTFTIPEGITAGTKMVEALGAGGTVAEASFTGQGTLEVDVMRRTTTITRSTSAGRARDGDDDRGEEAARRRAEDPQAQIFVPPTRRQMLGVDFHLCAIGEEGNHILVNQVTVETGLPTDNIVAEAFVSMIGAVEGWKSARYPLPVTTLDTQDNAFVIKTDDAEHAVSLAALGGFDAVLQQAVTKHPYPIGPRLSSVNARTWTPHQKEALTFRLVAARYPVTTKAVPLGEIDLVDCSDLQIRAVAELPNSACSVVFLVKRSNGQVFRMLPYQVLQFTEYLTETVEVEAVLSGTETMSPILYAPVQVIAGSIEEEGTYVTRGFSIENADRISAYLRVALPAGSTMSMRGKVDGGAWADVPVDATELSPDPLWVEQNHRTPVNGDLMQIEIKLTGGPAARPRAADFGLGVI